MCESLSLLAVGHRNVLSLCYFITQNGMHSGWYGSWSADEHDDTGLPTRLTIFFSWRGTEAIQYRQVMQYSHDQTWTNSSGQPTGMSLKTWSMISMPLVSITDECTWEADQVMDRIQDNNFFRLSASSQPLVMVSVSSQGMKDEMWCLVSCSECETGSTGLEGFGFHVSGGHMIF